MAPKPQPHPTRSANPPSTGRPAQKKGTATMPAPARGPFPQKTTVPAKMKRGPKG